LYDIAIIGLGPGGAALARLLDKDFKIVAIDKKGSDFTRRR
jgi:flavin-dependent dehydrogenase